MNTLTLEKSLDQEIAQNLLTAFWIKLINMIDQLSSQISPDTAGVLWFSDSPKRGKLFHFLNYLVDGLLEKSNIVEEHSDKSLFVSMSYDSPLYLGIIKTDGLTEAKEILSLIPKKDKKKKIILLDSHGDIEKKLQKQFPDLKFEKVTH